MKRTIKFRGKAAESGRWIYGYLASKDLIADDKDKYKAPCWVIPETVGQFTGLYDKTGKEIYEGDIITWLQHRMDRTGYIEQGHVEWRDVEGCYIVVNRFDTRDGRELIHKLIRCTEHTTVISNIHDTPELLRGGEE